MRWTSLCLDNGQDQAELQMSHSHKIIADYIYALCTDLAHLESGE